MTEEEMDGKRCQTCLNLNHAGQYVGDGGRGKKGHVYDTCAGFPMYRNEGNPPTPSKLCTYSPRLNETKEVNP